MVSGVLHKCHVIMKWNELTAAGHRNTAELVEDVVYDSCSHYFVHFTLTVFQINLCQ